jgi:hypothetical protein
MTAAELARLEDGLKISLPKLYVDLVRRLQLEAPYSQLREGHRPFWTGIRELLEFNLFVRSSPRGWCEDPEKCKGNGRITSSSAGYEHYRSILYLFDARRTTILEITRQKLESCATTPDLDHSTPRHSISIARSAKLKKKVRARYDWMLAAMPRHHLRASHERAADRQLVKLFVARSPMPALNCPAERKHSISRT